jgi:phenylalanyl-tRNA synthetase beta chain
MKISLKWLQDFVDVQDMMAKPEVLADHLTKAGLEVEEITSRAKDFQDVVVGLILEKGKHPNADKLSLCRVMTGEGVVHQIVCGAQNHKQDDKVVVALPGAVLPGGFAIKKSVIRDVESGGMLCSLKELGLATESQGILILPENAPIGKSFAEYQGFDDVTFELKVTPNRADCLSHYGLAREVACLLGRPLKKMEPQFATAAGSTKQMIGLEVFSEQCPRYAGRFIRGVKIQASPEWLKKRLESVGLNAINNVVDVTNYVMLELGQPLHAFDAGEIKGKKITVSPCRTGDSFETLQGAKLTLSGEELMIRDSERAVAMAGVVGGKNSGVSEATTDIFLEAAYFSPSAVRKTSRAHGITTDSAYRFSRGVDPDETFRAMDRAAELILQVAGGEALGEPHDHYPHPIKKAPVKILLQTVSDRLGYVAEAGKFEDYMIRLGCKLEKLSEGSYQILPPTYRFDLEIEMDLVEEYARLNGYDQIPETLPEQKLSPTPHDLSYVLSVRTSDVLRGAGYTQAVNMAFTGLDSQNKFLGNLEAFRQAGLRASDGPVQVLNPLTAEANVLRSSLAEGLYRNVHHNFHQGVELGRLFELGKTFSTKEDGQFQEHWRLGLVAWGAQRTLWTPNPTHPLVFEVKAAIEKLLSQLHITSYQWASPASRGNIPDFIHRGQFSVLMVEGKALGFIGTLHPSRLEDDKIRVPVAIGELDLELLFKGQPRGFRVETFSRFPKVERDLALVMAKALKVGDVVKEIRRAAGALCTQIEVFDVYEGDKLAHGQKSVAFRLSYQDKTATLQDAVVNDSVTQVLAALQMKYAITVR